MVGGTVARGRRVAPPALRRGRHGPRLRRLAELRGDRRLRSAPSSTRTAAPPTTALGVLGMPGFTACAGLLDDRPSRRPGETVVVAAASGPVGSVVGQIAQDQGRPRGRHRRRPGQVPPTSATSSASTPASTTAPPTSPAQLAAAVPGRHRRLLRERRRRGLRRGAAAAQPVRAGPGVRARRRTTTTPSCRDGPGPPRRH